MVDSDEVEAFELSELSDALLGWLPAAVVLISLFMLSGS